MTQELFLDLLLFSEKLPLKDFPPRDRNVLKSFQKQITQGSFLTKNQSNLLVRIYKENTKIMTAAFDSFEDLVKNPCWSKDFRTIPKIRKIFLDRTAETRIVVEFTYDRMLKNKLSDLSKQLDTKYNESYVVNSKNYMFSFTEKNIFLLVENFFKDDFEIDKEILDYYQEILEIRKKSSKKFEIFSDLEERHRTSIEKSIGVIDKTNLLQIYDKRFAYQYTIDVPLEGNSLEFQLARRKTPRIFVNSQNFKLDDVMVSLEKLNRLPVLFIFDSDDVKKCKQIVDDIAAYTKKSDFDKKVGIYFRFDKKTDIVGFNESISTLSFNHQLDDNISIAGIGNSKLPKFIMNLMWKPRAIVSFTNNFKNNRSSVYFSSVDLIVFFNDKKPFGEGIDDAV
jgi:hypothetical protein